MVRAAPVSLPSGGITDRTGTKLLDRRSISFLVLSLYIGLAAVFLLQKRHELSALTALNLADLALVALAATGFWLTTGWRFSLLTRIFGLSLRPREWLGLTVLTKFLNYFVPARGGIAIRGLYLRRVHGFPLSRFSVATAFLYLFNLSVNALFLAAAGTFLELNLGAPTLYHLVVAIVLVSIVGGLFLRKVKTRGPKKTRGVVGELRQALVYIAKAPGKVALLFVSQVVIRLVLAVELMLCFQTLGVEVAFVEILAISILMAISMLFSITPGNIGISEGIIAAGAVSLGYDLDHAIAASLLYRGVDVLLIGLAGGYFWRVIFEAAFPESRGEHTRD